MLRLLHTADVHLGARHTDLGERATIQRERQFAAFRTAVDLAISERVDLFLIAGDLFDSNTQPRRTVERVAGELGRLARASIRSVVIPGTHDVYDAASIYRAYDLAALARAAADWVVVLTPERSEVVFDALDAAVYARVFDTKRAPASPLATLEVGDESRAKWRIGVVHGALAIPGQTDGDDVTFSEQEIAATGLDYLALGHWHSRLEGRAGGVAWAYSGAPEPVAVDQDGAGEVLLVTLDDRPGASRVSLEPRRVGKTRFSTLEFDVSAISSQPQLVDAIAHHADPNLVLDVRLTGLFPDDLDMDLDEVEKDLATAFLRLRVRDLSIPGLSDEPLPPADTVLGAFIRLVEEKISAVEAARQNGAAPAPPAASAVAEAGGPPEAGARGPVAQLSAEAAAGAEGAAIVEAVEAEPNEAEATEPERSQTQQAETAPVGVGAVASAENGQGAAAVAAEADAAVALAAQPEVKVVVVDGADAAGEAAPVAPPPATATVAAGTTEGDIDELSELREVLRLGRHLLEGRTVTL